MNCVDGTYVRHPIQVDVSTIIEVVRLVKTKETSLCFAPGSREVPHHFESLFIDLCDDCPSYQYGNNHICASSFRWEEKARTR